MSSLSWPGSAVDYADSALLSPIDAPDPRQTLFASSFLALFAILCPGLLRKSVAERETERALFLWVVASEHGVVTGIRKCVCERVRVRACVKERVRQCEERERLCGVLATPPTRLATRQHSTRRNIAANGTSKSRGDLSGCMLAQRGEGCWASTLLPATVAASQALQPLQPLHAE